MLSTNNVTDIDNDINHQQPPLPRAVCILLATALIIAVIIGTFGNITVLGLIFRYKSLRTASNLFVVNLSIADLLMCIICLPMLISDYIHGPADNDIERVSYRYKSLRTASNLFVVNLSIADLLMCIICLPMLISDYIHGPADNDIERVFCAINMFLGAFTGFLSIWSLVCLAFDRCLVISRTVPVRYPSDKTKAFYIIIAIWLFCATAASFPVTGIVHYALDGRTISCEKGYIFTKSASNIAFNISLQVCFFAIPITCIISCYLVIFMKVRNHEKIYFSVRKSRADDEVLFRRMRNKKNLEQNEMKTARAGMILISVFCISWAPFSIVSWIGLFGNRALLTPMVISLPAIFAKILTIANPLLYALLLPSFKSKLVIFCKKCFLPKSSKFGSVQRNISKANCRESCGNNRSSSIPNITKT
ncbi:rhodopsin-like [Ruditapes philippinarum]|uniref:rhodopsin-like n=1 Tax=Ruditapes philippinarum TaxID=129788 RepID=UPI00295ADE1D|nr:rhodopsin-like [Ruditapes philippinarum]